MEILNPSRTELSVAHEQLKHAYEGRAIDLNKSISLTLASLEEFERMTDEEGIAKAKNQLGLFYSIQGEFDLGMKLSQQALAYFQSIESKRGQAEAKNNIGSIYYKTDNYHKGLILLLESLHLYRELEDFDMQARVLKSTGTIYEFFNDREKAIESYQKSIEASLKINALDTASNAYNPLSGIYLNQGEFDLAMSTIETSIRLKKQTRDIRGLGFALYGRGKIFSALKQYEAALVDFSSSEKILTDAKDKLGMGMVYNKTGIVHSALRNYDAARSYFEKAIAISEKYNVQFILFKAYFNLYELAKIEGNTIGALDYLEKYLSHKESVVNKEAYNIIKSYDAVAKIEKLEQSVKAQLEKSEIIENKNAELDSFFYRVSHDLKGPISTLLGLHQLAKMDIKDEQALQLFEMYHSQALRMNNIVMGLIHLTEVNNAEKLNIRIDFVKLVDDCIDSCRYLPHFAVTIVKKEIQEFEFYSEWAIINTILQNLIENSIKYCRNYDNPFVKITCTAHEDKVFIVVEDNGQGIPESHLKNIFNMFYRANDNITGSGLGLYILKRAVERLRGTIDVESVLHQGSRFKITLPNNIQSIANAD